MPTDMHSAPAHRPVTPRQSVQAALVAERLSTTPQGARQLVSRTYDLTVRIAQAQVRAGHPEPVIALIADLEALVAEPASTAPLPQLVLAHAEADSADDYAVKAWLLDQDNPSLRQRARSALAQTAVRIDRVLAALRRSA